MEAFRKIYPEDFYVRFLEAGLRPDGRSLDTLRSVSLTVGSIGTANGSSFVQLGRTSVVCGIKAQVGAPPLLHDGARQLGADVQTGTSSRAQAATHLLQSVFDSAKCPNVEELCIEEGKAVWYLFVDLCVLDDDGNMTDACVLAASAALRNVRLPHAWVEKDGQIKCDSSKALRALSMDTFPVSVSFCRFQSYTLVDPTREEQGLAHATVTVVYSSLGVLHCVHKAGGAALSDSDLRACMTLAKQRIADTQKLIQGAEGGSGASK